MKKIVYLLAIFSLIIPLSSSFSAEKKMPSGSININTASVEELMGLPGIGKSKAEAIVAFRQEHPFKAVSELVEVRGIGPKMLEKLQPYVTVDGSVATTPAATAQH